MTSPILVTGGTGTLGRHVVPRLRDAGCDVRVLSRHSHSPGTVVHLAGSAKGDEDKARNRVRAPSRAGVRHLVYISVVGADRIPISAASTAPKSTASGTSSRPDFVATSYCHV